MSVMTAHGIKPQAAVAAQAVPCLGVVALTTAKALQHIKTVQSLVAAAVQANYAAVITAHFQVVTATKAAQFHYVQAVPYRGAVVLPTMGVSQLMPQALCHVAVAVQAKHAHVMTVHFRAVTVLKAVQQLRVQGVHSHGVAALPTTQA